MVMGTKALNQIVVPMRNRYTLVGRPVSEVLCRPKVSSRCNIGVA
jgi:hypothetical protein